MPLLDTALKLATNIDVTADANGADVSLVTTLAALRNGSLFQCIMRFDGLIEHDTGNETLDVFIEEKVGSNYYTIGAFPRIDFDTAKKYNYAVMQSRLGLVYCYCRIDDFTATALRYRVDVTGTIASGGWNDMNIWINPLNFRVPLM